MVKFYLGDIMDSVSKSLILIGGIFILLGLLWHFSGGNIPFGRLPGDIRIENENTKIFIPITSCLVLSVLISIIGYFFKK